MSFGTRRISRSFCKKGWSGVEDKAGSWLWSGMACSEGHMASSAQALELARRAIGKETIPNLGSRVVIFFCQIWQDFSKFTGHEAARRLIMWSTYRTACTCSRCYSVCLFCETLLIDRSSMMITRWRNIANSWRCQCRFMKNINREVCDASNCGYNVPTEDIWSYRVSSGKTPYSNLPLKIWIWKLGNLFEP